MKTTKSTEHPPLKRKCIGCGRREKRKVRDGVPTTNISHEVGLCSPCLLEGAT